MITEVKNNYPKNHVFVEHMLGNICNFKCHYCFPGSNEGDIPWPDVDVVTKNMHLLFSKMEEQGKDLFSLNYLGGEPTLYKGLEDMIRFLKKEHNVIVAVTTNGSRKLGWWQKNGSIFDKVQLSVHNEYSNIDHVKAVADCLYDQNVIVAVNVMIDPANYERCIKILEQLQDSKRKWTIHAKIVHLDGYTNYTDDQKKIIKTNRNPNWYWFIKNHKEVVWQRRTKVKENGKWKRVPSNWFIMEQQNHFKGWSCNLGIDHIHIKGDGRISGTCEHKIWGADDFYSILDPELENKIDVKFQPVICEKNDCLCQAENCLAKKLHVVETTQSSRFPLSILERTFRNRNED